MHPTQLIYQEGATSLQLSHGQNNMRMNLQIQSAGKAETLCHYCFCTIIEQL